MAGPDCCSAPAGPKCSEEGLQGLSGLSTRGGVAGAGPWGGLACIAVGRCEDRVSLMILSGLPERKGEEQQRFSVCDAPVCSVAPRHLSAPHPSASCSPRK